VRLSSTCHGDTATRKAATSPARAPKPSRTKQKTIATLASPASADGSRADHSSRPRSATSGTTRYVFSDCSRAELWGNNGSSSPCASRPVRAIEKAS
jgi:hypothetical protein